MLPGDPNLLRQDADGNNSTFEALVAPLIKPAYLLAVTMLHDQEEARDAVQEATVKAWSKLGQRRAGMPLRPWFLAIVANQCRTIRRGRWWSVLKVGDPERTSDVAEDSVIAYADLKRALLNLPPADRLSLFLYFYLDLPVEEVAPVLGLTASAARSRIYRAVRRLRPELEIQELFP